MVHKFWQAPLENHLRERNPAEQKSRKANPERNELRNKSFSVGMRENKVFQKKKNKSLK